MGILVKLTEPIMTDKKMLLKKICHRKAIMDIQNGG
jgi:hypothetical protein